MPSPRSSRSRIFASVSYTHLDVYKRQGRAMAGQELDVVAERQELALDAGDQQLMAPAGQVGPPDRAGEQRVARQQESQILLKEGDMSRRMAGHMSDREDDVAERDLVALLQPARRYRSISCLLYTSRCV